MSLRILRLVGLPIEVKQCILSHLPRPALLSRSRRSPFVSLRPQSTVSILSPSSSLSNPSELQTLSSAIFEDSSSPDYSHVPPSTLDHPPAPRSPEDSLLLLLRSKDYSAASTLVNELQQSNQLIQNRYQFGLFAHIQLKELGWDSDWEKWWELSPLLVETPHQDVENLRKADSSMAQRAGKMCRNLKRTLQKNEENLDMRKKIVDKMFTFGVMLAKQGHSRVVAEELITEVTVEGGLEMGEALWNTCLNDMRVQMHQFKVEGEYLNRLTEKEKVMESELGEIGKKERSDARLEKRTVMMEEWFQSRQQETFRAFVRARERMIRALANSGQVDEAVRLVLQTSSYPSPLDSTTPVSLSKDLYLSVLALLSAQDRFDLLSKVYTQFEHQERRLIRIRRTELRTRTPYFARGLNYRGLDARPSAQEVFTTFRDQNRVSEIEEGSFEEIGEYSIATGEDRDYYGRSTSRRESERLIRLVEKGELDQALIQITELFSHGPLPSAQAVATFIHSINHQESGRQVLTTLEEHVKSSHWRRGFWATCRMLQELQNGDLRKVVRRFKDYFVISGLSPSIIASIKVATLRYPSTRKSPQEEDAELPRLAKSVPNAYTFAILMQALVPLLSEHHQTSGASRHLTNIYQSLLNSSFGIVPSHKRFAGGISSTRPRSPLDPYTFLPFLLLVLKRNRTSPQSQELLSILQDMQRLSISIPQPHLSLLVSSYARTGTLSEFKYLLSCLSSASLVSSPPVELSSNLKEFLEVYFKSDRKLGGELSPKLYRNVLKSLRLRGEKELGMETLKGLMEKVGVDGLRVMLNSQGGEGLREEVGRLGKE